MTHRFAAAALAPVAALLLVAVYPPQAPGQTGGLSITGPGPTASTQPGATTAPATQPAPATAPAAPATSPAAPPATQPDASATLETLLHSAPAAPAAPPVVSGPAIVRPTLPGVAPDQPKVTRLREGDHIWYRTGRLLRDEKTGSWVFAFDSDGKDMQDPPMTVLPSRMLKVMEEATDEGKKPVRLKINGEVTEYEGRNYLLVTYVQTVPDLNQF